MNETDLRAAVVEVGRSLHERGLTPGSSGNVSVRLPSGGWLFTPTGSTLGKLQADELSVLDDLDRHRSGHPPTKEVPLHLAAYEARPETTAVVHLHSPYAVALSVLSGLDADDVLPPLTAYYVMRVGRLPLVGYLPPGDAGLGKAVAGLLARSPCVLLANHGSLAAGTSLDAAVDAVEEIEQTARLWFIVGDRSTRPLTASQVASLDDRGRA